MVEVGLDGVERDHQLVGDLTVRAPERGEAQHLQLARAQRHPVRGVAGRADPGRVPADQLAEETIKLARQICAASSYTVALGKRAFYEQLPLDRPAAYEVAQKAMVENAVAPDAQEGMRAFLEKRAPKWQT